MKHLLTCCFLAGLCSGCSSLQLPRFGGSSGSSYVGADPGMMLDPSSNEQTYNAVRQAQSQNAIVLQVMGDTDPIRVLPLPAEGQSVLISDLLRQSGVIEKLGAINATLFRKVPSSPGGLRMTVRMDSKGATVRPETDYALQPGDRIQISRRSTDALQNLLGGKLGL